MPVRRGQPARLQRPGCGKLDQVFLGILPGWAALAACLALPSLAAAQAPAPAAPLVTPPVATPAPPPPHDRVDVADLVRKLFKKKPPPPEEVAQDNVMSVVSPIIGAKPSTGAVVGVAGNVAFFLGGRETTSISSVVGALTFSTRSQTSLTAHGTVFGGDDRWRLEVDDRAQWTSLETPGLGMPPPLDPELVKFDFIRLHHIGYMKVWKHLYAGAGFHYDRHADIGPDKGGEARWERSPFIDYSRATGLPLTAQTAAGPSAELIWDSRDSAIDPREGWMARANYRVLVDGLLGGDTGWEKLNLDVRAYRGLSKDRRHRLGVWGYGDFVTGGTAPYFQLPSTGSDAYGRSGRGYAEGHFRGERLAFLEVEYRGPLTDNGLLGMVAFANITSVASRMMQQELFDRWAPGVGVGLRLKVNKHSRTNLAFDIGFGERGNRGIYLAVQEAF